MSEADASTSNASIDHVPGSNGIPIFGNTFHYVRDPFGFPKRMHERYGSIYRSNVFFQRNISAIGPDVAERFFVDKDGLFSSEGGWSTHLAAFFSGGLMLRDFADHKLHRRIMQVAFRAQALRGYTSSIEPILAASARGLGTSRLPLFDVLKQTLLDTAASAFVGVPLGSQSDSLNRDFVKVMNATVAILRYPIPFLSYGEGLRARDRLRERIRILTREKRASAQTSDMLSVLCHAQSEEGERLTDEDVVDHMLFLLMAAHDTTASSLINMLMMLAIHPEWQERARQESIALGHEAFGYDDLDKLPAIDNVFREVLRLYPPVRTVPRKTTRECVLDGQRIPAGTHVWLTIEHLHRDPSLWTNPDAFDPDRFSVERAEHKRHKFAWLPFGAGAHTCIGLQFAGLEVKAFLHRVLSNFRFSLPSKFEPKMRYLPFVRPAKDLPIRFEKL